MAIASDNVAPALQKAGQAGEAPLLRVATRGAVTDMTNFGGAPYYVWQNLVRLGVKAVPHDTPMNRDFPLRRLRPGREVGHVTARADGNRLRARSDGRSDEDEDEESRARAELHRRATLRCDERKMNREASSTPPVAANFQKI